MGDSDIVLGVVRRHIMGITMHSVRKSDWFPEAPAEVVLYRKKAFWTPDSRLVSAGVAVPRVELASAFGRGPFAGVGFRWGLQGPET